MTERLVIKVGGSLLELKESAAQLQQMFENDFQGKQVNLIFGGGPVIEALRELDLIHHFDSEMMHWWCVDLLHLTFEMASQWFPNAIGIENADAFERHRHHDAPGFFLFSTRAFYTRSDQDTLPCDWTTTSDSIAAFLAKRLNINHLILLKACHVPNDLNVHDAASLGIVDEFFPQASLGLRVQFLQMQKTM